MKVLIYLAFVLVLGSNLINCQEAEETDDAELIPPINTNRSPKGSGDDPITSITSTIANGTMSIFTRIADKISNSWTRIRDHMQDRYQRSIERLQRRAVDSMERLQEYVQKRMNSATDENTKKYLESLNTGIKQIIESLRNLMTNVESKVDQIDQRSKPTRSNPAYKFEP